MPLELTFGDRLPAALTPKNLILLWLAALGKLQHLRSELQQIETTRRLRGRREVRERQVERSITHFDGKRCLQLLSLVRGQLFVVPPSGLERLARGWIKESCFFLLSLVQVVGAES